MLLPAGVGKTLSARRVARWDQAQTLVEEWGERTDSDAGIYAALNRSRTVFYTPTVGMNRRQLDNDISKLTNRVDICIDQHVRPDTYHLPGKDHYVDLLIIDEAERLTPVALEYLRDRYDRRHLGLLLIGMPGIEKRLARYPQLYSRIGFAHQYHTLADDELAFVLTRDWKRLGLTLDLSDFTDAQPSQPSDGSPAANFRLIHRLFAQIERILQINDLTVITSDVIEAARSTLVIGDT